MKFDASNIIIMTHLIQIRIYTVILIILIIFGNWNEFVLCSYHDQIQNEPQHKFLTLHNNHHHQQQQQQQQHQRQHNSNSQHIGSMKIQQTQNEFKNRYRNRYWSSSTTTKPLLATTRNRIDEAVHAFHTTTTTNSPLLIQQHHNHRHHHHNHHQHNHPQQATNHRQNIDLRRTQSNSGQTKNYNLSSTTKLYQLNKSNNKFNSNDHKTLSKSFHKKNFMISPATTTVSPPTASFAWITNRPNYFNIPPATFTPKSIQSNNHQKDADTDDDDDDDDDVADDSYYYDPENDDPDDQDDQDDQDADDYVDATIHRNRKYPIKYDQFMDDYQFDEPLNRIHSDKTGSASLLTEHKWREYGTAEAVENSRRKSLTETQLVTAHITRVHMEAMCKYPSPKIIQINEASKRYVPHCTVLHRCGDDTGCCHSDTHKCVAKKTTTIDLYFYAIPLGIKDPIVEILSFINHTECHCVERYNKSTRLTRSHRLSSSLIDYQNYHHNQQQQQQHHHNQQQQQQHHLSKNVLQQNEGQLLSNENNNYLNINHTTTTTQQKKVDHNYCHCTKHFHKFEETNQPDDDDDDDIWQQQLTVTTTTRNVKKKKCQCDCLVNNEVCQRQKKGQEGFSYDERLCIREELCTAPNCQFGNYTNNTGRCPRNGAQKPTK